MFHKKPLRLTPFGARTSHLWVMIDILKNLGIEHHFLARKWVTYQPKTVVLVCHTLVYMSVFYQMFLSVGIHTGISLMNGKFAPFFSKV